MFKELTQEHQDTLEQSDSTDRETINCPICKKRHQDLWLQCSECKSYTHAKCANIDEHSAERLLEFYCSECESSLDIETLWEEEFASQHKATLKRREYHEVDEILGHSRSTETEPERTFLVKWAECSNPECDDSITTWEPESHLDGCVNRLNTYLRKVGEPLTTMRQLIGASNSQDVNKDIWIDMETTLNLFMKLKSWRHMDNVNIPIERWTNFKEQDGLYFLDYDSHCYVILYLYSENLGYLADGGNLFSAYKSVSAEIKRLLRIPLTQVKFNFQTRVDHCSSSAIAIGMELLRAYKKMIPNELICSAETYKYILNKVYQVKSIHRFYYKSKVDQNYKPGGSKRIKCFWCDKTYLTKDRRAFNMHTRQCPLQPGTSKK